MWEVGGTGWVIHIIHVRTEQRERMRMSPVISGWRVMNPQEARP